MWQRYALNGIRLTSRKSIQGRSLCRSRTRIDALKDSLFLLLFTTVPILPLSTTSIEILIMQVRKHEGVAVLGLPLWTRQSCSAFILHMLSFALPVTLFWNVHVTLPFVSGDTSTCTSQMLSSTLPRHHLSVPKDKFYDFSDYIFCSHITTSSSSTVSSITSPFHRLLDQNATCSSLTNHSHVKLDFCENSHR